MARHRDTCLCNIVFSFFSTLANRQESSATFIVNRHCDIMYRFILEYCSSKTVIGTIGRRPDSTVSSSQVRSILQRGCKKKQHWHSAKETNVRPFSSSVHQTDENDDDEFSFLYSLPWQFLRAADSANFDEATHQRNDVLFESATGKPILTQTRSSQLSKHRRLSIDNYSVVDGNKCNILWSDGWMSSHDLSWLERQFHRWRGSQQEDRKLWSGMTEHFVRNSSDLSMSFQELIEEDGTGMSRALKALYEYGILLVTKTPMHDNGECVAALGAALSGGSVKDRPSTSILASYRAGGREIVLPFGTDGPLRTLYGRVWSTSSADQADGTSVADSAYSNDALPLHTDSSYLRDPPGLQIFTMVQTALVGGESVICDGFAVAEVLRTQNPDAFKVLSTTTRRYHSQDTLTGWHLEASGPVIQVRDNQIVGIRHNDLDRLPDIPPNDVTEPQEIDEFYDNLSRAHAAWDALLAQDKFRLVVKLQPGDTIVVANQV